MVRTRFTPSALSAAGGHRSRRGFFLAKLLPELLVAALAACGIAVAVNVAPRLDGLSLNPSAAATEDILSLEVVEKIQPIFNVTQVGDGCIAYSTMQQGLIVRTIDPGRAARSLPTSHRGVLRIAGAPGVARMLVRRVDGAVMIYNDIATDDLPILLMSDDPQPGVVALTMSACGRWAAVAGPDATVSLWDLDHPDCPKTIERLPSAAIDLKFAPDGARLAIVDVSGVKLYDRESAALVQSFPFTRFRTDPMEAAWSPTGRCLAVSGFDGVVHLWDTESGRLVWEADDFEAMPLCAAFSQDERSLLVGAQNGNLLEFDARTGAIVRAVPAHPFGARTLMHRPGTNEFLSHGYDGHVKCWTWDQTAASRLIL